MRTKNSMFNMAAAFGSQIITVLLGFISRTVFITALGAEYLGVNGLFTNILSIISLAESGIGSSIVYSLYKPVAENDEEKILILMNVYRKAFKVIGLIVFTIGITIMPFLKYFINGETGISNLYLIYFIFVFNSAITYLFSYKISFGNFNNNRLFCSCNNNENINIIFYTKLYFIFSCRFHNNNCNSSYGI